MVVEEGVVEEAVVEEAVVEEAVVEFLSLLIKHTITNNNTQTITYLKVHVPSFVSWWASYGMVASFSVVLVVCFWEHCPFLRGQE